MNDDLRQGGTPGGAIARRARAARFWPGERWRAAPLKATVTDRGSEKVGDVPIAWREVTFASEPLPGQTQRIVALFATPERSRAGSGATALPARSAAPALVLIHDLGETPAVASAKEWAARGYAALALDLPGRGPGRDLSSHSEGPEFTEAALFRVTPDPSASYLFHAVAAVVRAEQWLREQPEVDRQRVALVGRGWGAVIARLTAVAEERTKALVLLHAAGNLDSGPAGEGLRGLPAAERALWRSRFDPTSYAAEDAPAALFVGATGATRFPLDHLVAAARAHRGPRALALSLGAEEELDAPTAAAIRAWLDRALRGTSGAVSPRAVREDGDTVTVELPADAPARAVSLYVADGAGSWSGRTWKEVKATRADDRRFRAILSREKDAPLPLYFVRVTDARGGALAALPPVARARAQSGGR
jgi:dienelactone hydrolase